MREITVAELARLRTRPQGVELRLACLEAPPVVFAAQVNQASFGTTAKPYDQIAQATFDNVTTGVYTDVIPGMTMYVGSTPGAYDLGIVRARKAFTSSIAYFGETSDVPWANDIYLTVVDEMDLWPKHVRIINKVPYMDYELAYSNQHDTLDPVPVMGADKVVDADEYPVIVGLDSSLSWVLGSSISSHAWTASAGSLADPNTSTPTLTINSYPTGGRIRLKCTVTAASGKSYSGYRYIYVYDATHRPLVTKFQLDSCEGNYEDGGWNFDVTLLENATLANVRERAKVILYAVDHYGATDQDIISMGHVAGSENIVAMGWIEKSTIRWNSQASVVSFAVRGPNFWLDTMPGFPPGVEIRRGNVTAAWTNIANLTVDKALWHLLHWRSTATTVIDVLLTDDDRIASAFEVPTDSIWAQMVEIAETSIFAHPCSNRYGQLFVEVDANLTPEADRTWPVIMEITSGDMEEEVEIDRLEKTETAMLDLSGVAVNSSGKGFPYFSLANGHIFKRHGRIEISDRLLLEDQDQSNELAGLAMAKVNNPYSDWKIRMWANNRFMDIAPRHFVSVAVSASENARGVAYTGNLINRNVSHDYDNEKNILRTENGLEAETFPEISIIGDSPADDSIPPDNGGEVDPPLPPPVDTGDVPPDGPPNALIWTSDFGMMYCLNFNEAGNQQWFFMNAGVPLTGNPQNFVRRVKKCPSGLLLVGMSDSDESSAKAMKYLYYAPGLGGVWTLLADHTTIDQGTYGVPRISAFGVNEEVSEEILMVAGGYTGLNIGAKKIYYGTRAGLSEVGAVSMDIENNNSDLSFGMGKWILTANLSSSLNPGGWARMLQDGTLDAAFSTFASPGLFSDKKFHHRGGGKVFHTEAASHATLRIIENNDPNVETLVNPGFSFDDLAHGISVSPDGTRLIGGDSGVISKRSSDGGYTWGNVGTGGGGGMTVGYNVYANGGNNDWFFAATTQKVIGSNDFGDTWEDKSGNLATVAPLCNIIGMMVW